MTLLNRVAAWAFLLALLPIGPLLMGNEARAAHQPRHLESSDMVVGAGAEAVRHSKVTVHYTGWLEDGTKFDSSLDRNRPFEFVIGSGQVIAGWEMGVQGMRVGGKRVLTIPPALAYGKQGAGGVIPANATLKFEIELLGVEGPKYGSVDNDELKSLLARGVKIVDLRTKGEWAETGVIEGSVKLTAFDENRRYVKSFHEDFAALAGKDEEVIVICRSGSRSSRIANFLAERLGYTKVINVSHGIKKWIAEGNPTVK